MSTHKSEDVADFSVKMGVVKGFWHSSRNWQDK